MTRHFAQNQRGDLEAAIGALQVVLVDSFDTKANLEKTDDRWMCNLGTLFLRLNSHNKVLSNKRRNVGAA